MGRTGGARPPDRLGHAVPRPPVRRRAAGHGYPAADCALAHAEWEQSYGRDIPGQNCAGQLAAVERWYQDDQRDTGRLHAVAWGLRPQTAIEQAVGAQAGAQDWAERVASQLTVFLKRCRWPLDYLKASSPARQERA